MGSLGILCSCLVEEELAQTVIPFNFGDVTPLLFDCNSEQKEKYFFPAFNKQKFAYLALMEPGRETELPAMETRAEKINGHYVLNGKKVSLSKAGDDYFAVVFATTEKGASNEATCFRTNASGL